MFSHQTVEGVLEEKNLLGLDFNVHCLALGAAEGLVNHDPGIGQGQALALGATREQEGTHGCGQAVANGHHVWGDLLHRVVDRQAGGH